jgi:4-amino-4-deoxy-L-arabinose transferase-like glycosyltransferase
MKQARPYWPLILFLAIIKFILPFILQSSVYELQRDEYLYYQQGLHFDFGYLENPPLLSYLGMVSSWLGGSEFAIKLWPSLFGSLTVIFTCLMTAEFGGNRFAQFVAGIAILCGAFMRVHSLFQPNFLDIFFWTASVYFIVRYIHSSKTRFLYLLCFSLALGFLSKYSIIFLAFSLFLPLLLGRHRKIFFEKRFYQAALLSLFVILPNILWQYSYNWPLVHHMEELQETQLKYINPVDFIIDQLLFLLPVVFVWIVGLVWLWKNKPYRFLFFTYFLVIILLLIGRGKSYYSLGIYPALLAVGAASIERWSLHRRPVRIVLAILTIGLIVLLIPLLLPIWKPATLAKFYRDTGVAKAGMLKWEDQQDHSLPQDFADMLGWEELALKTKHFFYSNYPKSNAVIFCDNYGQAGSLIYYAKDDYFSYRVISANGSFLLWIPDRLWFEDLIYVGEEIPAKESEVFQHFEKMTVVDSVTNPYSRQFGNKIIFYENIDSAGLALAQQQIRALKDKFN